MKDLNKKDWELVKLGDVSEIRSGGTPSRKRLSNYGGSHLWAKISDIERSDGTIHDTEEKITEEGLADIRSKIFRKGTLLLAIYGSVGKVAFAGKELSTNQAILGINILDESSISYKYLRFWFQTIKAQLLNRAVGGTLQNISLAIVKDLDLPLPPLSTQKYIAQILDKADALRKKDQQLLQYYDDLSQSLFINLFGDPVKNEKGWEVKKLGEVCTKITDGTHFSPPSLDSGIPYVTAKHLKENFIDFYSKPTYISIEEHNEIYKRCTPEYGDVLYIKDGATTGIAAINKFDFEFSMLSSLALIKVKKEILNNFYLSHWLNNQDIKGKYIREFMAGAAIRRFTLDKMKRFEILVPPIQLQNQFAQQIQNIEKQIEKVKAQMQASEETFQSLLQQVFA